VVVVLGQLRLRVLPWVVLKGVEGIEYVAFVGGVLRT
jgi:branched-subunit amino acid transport protein AzlD